MAINHKITIKEKKTNQILLEEDFGGNNIFNKEFYEKLNIDDKINWDKYNLSETKIDYKDFFIEFYRTTIMYLGLMSNETLKELLCYTDKNEMLLRLTEQQYYNNIYKYINLKSKTTIFTKFYKGVELLEDLELYISITGKPNRTTYTYYYNK